MNDVEKDASSQKKRNETSKKEEKDEEEIDFVEEGFSAADAVGRRLSQKSDDTSRLSEEHRYSIATNEIKEVRMPQRSSRGLLTSSKKGEIRASQISEEYNENFSGTDFKSDFTGDKIDSIP